MEIACFLISVIFISMPGVLMPGPVLAVVVNNAPHDRFSGFKVVAGHLLLELPLVVALAFGFASFIKSDLARASIGAAGGAALLLMGISSIRARAKDPTAGSAASAPKSLWHGLLATINPYFFLWWATAGAAMIAKAMSWSAWILALMFVLHILVDFAWFGAVGIFVSKSVRIGSKWQTWVIRICAVAMIAIAIYFIGDAANLVLVSH